MTKKELTKEQIKKWKKLRAAARRATRQYEEFLNEHGLTYKDAITYLDKH